MRLSIVSTLYRSAPYLREFHARAAAAAAAITPDVEFVYVNDGSPDEALDVALDLHREHGGLLQHREVEFVISGLWARTGFLQVPLPVAKGRKPTTTYNLSRKIRLLVNSITSFSSKPLHYIFYLGLAMFALTTMMAGA